MPPVCARERLWAAACSVAMLFKRPESISPLPRRRPSSPDFPVVLVPVFLGLFARQRVGPGIWAGALVAVAGLYYLTVPSSGFGDLNRGDLLVLCGAVAFALHIIAIGHYARRQSPGVLNLLQVAMTLVMISLAGRYSRWRAGNRCDVTWTAEPAGGRPRNRRAGDGRGVFRAGVGAATHQCVACRDSLHA